MISVTYRIIGRGLLGLALSWVLVGCSAAKDLSEAKTFESAPFDASYELYGTLLGQFVHGDRVDYEWLSDHDEELEEVVAGFASLTSDSLEAMSENDQIAFYVNAYNAITLYSIIERYGDIESIKDISGVWKKRKWNVAGDQMTLNDIENKKLRVDYDEPRIHFAINCASIGCPPLSTAPYLGSSLDEQLAESTRAFFNDSARFAYDGESGRLHISKIFKWFGDDFVGNRNARPKNSSLSKKDAAIVAFIAARLPEELSGKVLDGAKSIKHTDYDWKLNDIDRD